MVSLKISQISITKKKCVKWVSALDISQNSVIKKAAIMSLEFHLSPREEFKEKSRARARLKIPPPFN